MLRFYLNKDKGWIFVSRYRRIVKGRLKELKQPGFLAIYSEGSNPIFSKINRDLLVESGRKANGEYQFGKMEPYLPHAAIDVRIFQEYIKNRGSKLKTALALADVTFPSFSPELAL